jgi:arginase
MSFSGDLMQRLERSYALHHRPVVLGGDHSISIPSVSAGSRFLRETHGAEAPLGLIWVDAHPDLETPDTTTSGDLHGMPVAVLLGHGAPDLCHLGGFAPKVDPRHVVYIGLRDVLPEERAIIQQYGITAYSASDVEGLGIAEICERTFTFMAEHAAGFVLSFDIDACDPSEAPAVQYPEPGGLTRREARVIMEYAAQAPNLTCLELVELDPSLDTDTRTSDLGLWLLRAALAGPIL